MLSDWVRIAWDMSINSGRLELPAMVLRLKHFSADFVNL